METEDQNNPNLLFTKDLKIWIQNMDLLGVEGVEFNTQPVRGGKSRDWTLYNLYIDCKNRELKHTILHHLKKLDVNPTVISETELSVMLPERLLQRMGGLVKNTLPSGYFNIFKNHKVEAHVLEESSPKMFDTVSAFMNTSRKRERFEPSLVVRIPRVPKVVEPKVKIVPTPKPAKPPKIPKVKVNLGPVKKEREELTPSTCKNGSEEMGLVNKALHAKEFFSNGPKIIERKGSVMSGVLKYYCRDEYVDELQDLLLNIGYDSSRICVGSHDKTNQITIVVLHMYHKS